MIDRNAECAKICPWVHIIHYPGGSGQAEALMPSEEDLASQKESALARDPQLSHWVPISWVLLHRFYRAIALQCESQKAKTTKPRSLSSWFGQTMHKSNVFHRFLFSDFFWDLLEYRELKVAHL